MARAEAVVLFQEHRPVSLDNARKAVKKAGFEYLGAEVVARGHLGWSGEPEESDLLLTDPRAKMSVRLSASDTGSAHDELRAQFTKGDLADTVQVRGTVVESKQARRFARDAGAQFTLSITAWSRGRSAKLPPLVPGSKKKQEPKPSSDDDWF